MSPRSRRAPRAEPTTPASGPSYFYDYFEVGIDPLEDDLSHYDAESVPLAQLQDGSQPVGLFITAYFIRRARGHDRTDLRTGFADLFSRRGHQPLSDIVAELIRSDEATIRQLGREAAEERLAAARQLPNGPTRDRRIAAAEQSVENDGRWRWHSYSSAVASLHGFALDLGVPGIPAGNPARGLIGSAQAVATRTALSEEQLEAVWHAAASYRDAELAGLILDFLRETASRRQSLVDLRLDDVNWAAGSATLHTKFDRTHEVLLSEDLLSRIALRAFRQGWDGQSAPLEERRNPSRAVFKRANGKPISSRDFDSLFDHIDNKMQTTGDDFGFKTTAHYIRHTTIAQIERIAGRDVAAQWAGHESHGQGPSRGDATSIYIRWRQDELAALFNRMFKNPTRGLDIAMLHEKYLWMVEHGEI